MIKKTTTLLCSSAALLTLSACGGGGGGTAVLPNDQGNTTTRSIDIDGGAVKGPLAFANVRVFAFDATATGFKGTLIDTATTNSKAAIEGLAIPETALPPFVLEMTSTQGTTIDLTTGAFPVIHTLRTVITKTLLDKGEKIYATPLTTMAVDLAIKKLQTAGGTITAAAFEAALQAAATSVISTVGFGLSADVDIFDTPPLIDDSTDTAEEQADVAAYRTAVEALTAVVHQMNQQAQGGGDTNTVLAELAADLADDVIDGNVDGTSSGVLNTAALDVLNQDPDKLPIPGAKTNPDTNQPYTVGEIEDLLEDETSDTGSTTDTSALANIDTQTQPAETNPDKDGDGVLNAADAFPLDANETHDNDRDGLGDNADSDDDNDGVLDDDDAFPLNAAEQLDTDNDGTGDNADDDKDGDGVANANDDYPLDSTRSDLNDQDGDGWDATYDEDDNNAALPGTPFLDTDQDGVPDSHDADDDNDGVEDSADAFSLDASEQVDTDDDGTGDNADTDDDGDGVNDIDDAFPKDEGETLDSDHDGLGNNADTDDDNDGLSDIEETNAGSNPLDRDSDDDGYLDGSDDFPNDPNETTDTDNDGTGNNADDDDDGDGLSDTDEASNGSHPLLADSDGDSINDGDEVTAGTNPTNSDTDNDGVDDAADRFPTDGSETVDTDNDGTGDNADAFDNDPTETTDTDGDGTGDNADAFDNDPTETTDTDGDGTGDNADAFDNDPNETTDSDNDGVGDNADAFDNDPTETTDSDGDGTGDNADVFDNDPTESGDNDSDGIGNNGDNCPDSANADQTDSNNNDVGNACESAPVANDIGSTTAPMGVLVSTAKPFDVLGATSDADGDMPTISSFTQGSSGTVSENNGMLSYTSSALGTDSFTYTVSDGHLSDTATVYINVINNQPPEVADGSLTVNEDGSGTTTDLLLGATDAEADSISIKSADTVSDHGGSITNNNDGTFTYTPAPNFNGMDLFSVLATDGNSDVSVAVNITVTAQNDAPTLSGTPPMSIVEGGRYSFSPNGGDVDLSDPESTEMLSYSISGNPTWMSINTATGVVSGTATGLGQINNIVISVADSADSIASLTPFSVTVTEAPPGPLQVSGIFSGSFTASRYEMTSSSGGLDCMDSDEYQVGIAETYTSIIDIDGVSETFMFTSADSDFGGKGTFNPTDNSMNLSIVEEHSGMGTGPNGGQLSYHMNYTASGNFDPSTGVLTQSWLETTTLTESATPGGIAYSAVCEAQGSDTATLHSNFSPINAQSLLAESFAWIENEDEEEAPAYGLVAYVGGIATDELHSYNPSTENWQTLPLDEVEPILDDAGQWQVVNWDALHDGELSFIGDSLERIHSAGIANAVFGRETIDISTAAIAGLPIKDFFPSHWQNRLLNPMALMPAGAAALSLHVTNNLSQHVLWDGQWDCPAEQYTLLNNSCNSVDRQIYNTSTLDWNTEHLTNLDDLIQTTSYDPAGTNETGPTHIWLENSLAAELLVGGTVRFYDGSVSWDQLTPMTETATWIRSQPMGAGAEVIQFTVPEALTADWQYQEDRHVLLSVHNGYVRRGATFMAGETERELSGMFNKTAMDAITANFDLQLIAGVPEAPINTNFGPTGSIDMTSTSFTWIDNGGDNGTAVPEYGVIAPDTDEQNYLWDAASSQFVLESPIPYEEAFMTDKGWVTGNDFATFISATPSAVLMTDVVSDTSAEVTGRFYVAIHSANSLAETNISTTVSNSTDEWANLISATSVFSSGAMRYETEFMIERDKYSFDLADWSKAQEISTSGQMTNVIDLATTVEKASTIVLGHDQSSNVGYGVRFTGGSTSGTADYASHNFTTGEIVSGLATGNWDLVRVNGEYLLRFEIPSAFAMLYGDEGEHAFLTPYQNSVHKGHYEPAGTGGTFDTFNNIALDDIKAATNVPTN